ASVSHGEQTGALFLGLVLHLGGACVLRLVTLATSVRAWESRHLDMALAAPLPRWAFHGGRAAGFALLAWAFPLLWLPAAVWSSSWSLAWPWALALGCEYTLVSAAGLLFATALGRMVPAFIATALWYVTAQSLDEIRTLAQGSFAAAAPLLHAWRDLPDWLGWFFPALDRFASAGWLVHPELANNMAWPWLGGETAVFTLLLTVAGLYDFQRRNL
ncbi:MAG: hypothetical protein H7831_17465, partial [Magnetococcus sp. WYHC-3]